MAVTEVSKAAGVQWNALKDKSKWEKLAAEDKVRYEREMAQYQKSQ
jgi:structure-specific recognition protein 1